MAEKLNMDIPILETDVEYGLSEAQVKLRKDKGLRIRTKNKFIRFHLLNKSYMIVIRDGKEQKVSSWELVRDDIVKCSSGNQICADAVIVFGTISVNELHITGEYDLVKKCVGDTLLSGSYVVSGSCYVRLTKIEDEKGGNA